MKKILSTLALLLSLTVLSGCISVQIDESEPNSPSEASSAQTTLQNEPSSTTLDNPPEQTNPPTTTEPPVTEPPVPNGDRFPPPAVGDGPEIEYTPSALDPTLLQITDLSFEGFPVSSSQWDRFMIVNFLYTENSDGMGYAYAAQEADELPDDDFPEFDDDSPEFLEWTDVAIIDLLTGELTASYRFDGSVEAGFLDNGYIYLYDHYPLSLTVYDLDGDAFLSYTHPTDGYIYIDPTGEGTAWASGWDTNEVERLPLGGGETLTYTIPDAEWCYIQTTVNGDAYVSAYDEHSNTELYLLSADGEAEKLSALRSYYCIGDTLYIDSINEFRYIDLNSSLDQIYSFALDREEAYVLDANDTRFCFVRTLYDEYYNVTEHTLILCLPEYSRQIELSLSDQYFFEQCWSDGSLYLMLSSNNVWTLYEWDYQSAPYEELTTSVDTISEQETLNYELAEQLKAEWGISVFFGEADMVRTPSDYIADPLYDQTLIYEKLLELSRLLDDYPEGFFRDLPYGFYDHLEIYFCAGLSPADSYGINTAIAISNTNGSAMQIVLDVTVIYDMTGTFAHELMHLMERRIEQIDPNLLADWPSLTPGGDNAYYYSYHDENGEEMNDYSHTWSGEYDPELMYFVDAYSKSYPTEDRARIFEYLVDFEGNPSFLDSPVLRAKAERLCEIIRLTFPSVAAAENVSWEIRGAA